MTTYTQQEVETISKALQAGTHGGFAACLGDALARADRSNTEKLCTAFSDLFSKALRYSQPEPEAESEKLLILVDFDGDDIDGVFRVYPANDESEPEGEFKHEFWYSTKADPSASVEDFHSRTSARRAAQQEAQRLATQIGGDWMTNEN